MRSSPRWMKSWNISLASHAKQRNVAKRWHGEDYVVEDTPFFFPIKDTKGKYEIGSAARGYIKDLPSHVVNFLDSLDK